MNTHKILSCLKMVILTIGCFLLGGICRGFIAINMQPLEPDIRVDHLSHEDSLRLRIISTGDVISYLELKDTIEKSKFPHEILFYSVVMAKQYGYKPAYGHFCSQLKSFYDNKNMKPMDVFTDSIYHDFLRKASDSE